MLKIVGNRILAAIPMLLFVSFFVYVLLDLIPGDAAESLAGESAPPERIEALRSELGLDKTLLVRYFDWVVGAVQGDLGRSLYSSESVTQILLSRLPVTLSLTIVSMLLVVTVGIPLGIYAAMHANSKIDRAITAISGVALAVPAFILGLILVVVFAITMPILPATGYSPIGNGIGDWLRHLVLPALALASVPVAELARQTRAAMIDTLGKDFVRTARAKGLRRFDVVGKHALKNAGVPIATVVGLQVNRVLTGVVTVEVVFALQGFGALAVNSVFSRDIPVILGLVVATVLIIAVVNVVVDLSYGYFNPRVRQ
ncbi:peptide/nickel transport system permease protein [Rhodococcus sp. 27YEA15]|uniref:ABC transporter permease n=1 Tax=Rhodococcus sp. 27YEA15 TaxID=3156259 RepID=UPI003C7E19A9